jgi:hypothetical protein
MHKEYYLHNHHCQNFKSYTIYAGAIILRILNYFSITTFRRLRTKTDCYAEQFIIAMVRKITFWGGAESFKPSSSFSS